MTPLFPSGPERVFPSQESGDFRRFRASESSSRRDPGSPGLQQTSFPSLGRPWPPARSADGTRPWRGEQRPKSKEEPSSGRSWPLGVQGPLPAPSSHLWVCVPVTQKQDLPNTPLMVLPRTWPNCHSEKHARRRRPGVGLPRAWGLHKCVPLEAHPWVALVSLSAPLQPRRWARTGTFTPAGDSVTGVGGVPGSRSHGQAGGKAAAPAVTGLAWVTGHGSQPDAALLSKAWCCLLTWQVARAGRGTGRTSAGGQGSQDPARDMTQKPRTF